MGEQRIRGVRRASGDELPEGRLLPRSPKDLGVEAFEEPRPARRGGVTKDETTNQGLTKNVITAEDLVRALARADDFDSLVADEAGEEKHRDGRGPQQGRFAVPDDPRKCFCDASALRPELPVLDPEECSHLVLMNALVEHRIVKADAERPEPPIKAPGDQSGDAGGIQPAAEIGPDRHVGTEADPRRIREEGRGPPR